MGFWYSSTKRKDVAVIVETCFCLLVGIAPCISHMRVDICLDIFCYNGCV